MTRLSAISVSVAALMSAGCIHTEPPVSLPPVAEGVGEVRVVARVGCSQPSPGSGDLCSVISSPEGVASIVAFVNARPDGWSTPFAGAPIHPVRIEFYRDGRFVEALGLSAFSIERRTFLSRRASRAEVDEVLGLVGLDRSNLRFRLDDPIPE
jgi:hypothetical protein